jgi:branched-chain amino acid transport system permease protein
MSLQFLADGLLIGAMIGLGAIGVTLTYSILGFANFVHGEFVAWGAYACLVIAGLIGTGLGIEMAPIGPFSIGWVVLIAGVLAMVFTGCLALALDWLLFRRLRRHGNAIVMVMASFGASMALRSLLEFLFSSEPAYFSRDIQMAIPIGLGMRVTADQMLMLAVTAVLVIGMHLLITRTTIGRSMRAVAENPHLAAVAGIDVTWVIRKTWLIGGALACAAGIVAGITVQIRPFMGFDLLLPMFAAAILGGIGSVPGAVVGGLIVGLAESMAVQFVGAEYRAAVAFLLLIAVLLVRPAGLFGRAEA